MERCKALENVQQYELLRSGSAG